MHTIAALTIFGLTIALILFRPARLSEALIACAGGLAMLLLGMLSPAGGVSALANSANILLFFLGLLVLSAIAELAGFFDWSAALAVKYARGSARRLFIIVFAIGVAITAILSNDATALLLTPVVYVLATRLKLDPLPYVFICAFTANAASLLLPVSNPVNLLAIDRFGIRLGQYLHYLLLPALLAVIITLGLFLFIFKDSLKQKFDASPGAFKGHPLFAPTASILLITVVGYAVFSAKGWPLSVPVLFGSAVLLVIGLLRNQVNLKALSRSISWSILPFIAGLTLLVAGLEASGVTHSLGDIAAKAAGGGNAVGSGLLVSFGTAVGANVMNNWPAMMVAVTSLAGITPAAPAKLVYLSMLGADLGPNIAVMGSLSTMLWLVLLRRRGLNVSATQFFKLGLAITPVALLAASLAIIWTG